MTFLRFFTLATLSCNPQAYYAMREAAFWRHAMLPGAGHWSAFRFVYPV
jgi:hypothetical protein